MDLEPAKDTAREYCQHCPVIAACGQEADQHDAQGIWGGELRRRPRLRGGRLVIQPLLEQGAS